MSRGLGDVYKRQICGRYDRRGGMTRITGALSQPLPENMGPLPIPTFSGEVSRVRGIRGISGLFGYNEMPTNTLTDEILTPGKGQVRALIVNGGNPALVFSNAERTVEALKSLDLLVCLDLFESATAKYADYIMAVKHPFERNDIPHMMNMFYPQPYMQYTDKLVEPPPGTTVEMPPSENTNSTVDVLPADCESRLMLAMVRKSTFVPVILIKPSEAPSPILTLCGRSTPFLMSSVASPDMN